MQLAPTSGMLWLAVGAAPQEPEGMEDLLPRLASILRYTSEVERQLAGDALGGLVPVRELHRRIVAIVAALAPDVVRARETVADLVASLRAMEQTLAALRRLKVELGHTL